MTAKKILEDLVSAWMEYEGETFETRDDRFLTSIAVDTIIYLNSKGKKWIREEEKK